jgi:hypothetical protein
VGEEQEKKPTFQVDAGVLKINKELDEIDPEELVAALRQLARSGAAAPVLDLGGISFLPSYHVSGIRSIGDECVREGRALTVCAKKNVKTLLERMGLGAAVRLRAID